MISAAALIKAFEFLPGILLTEYPVAGPPAPIARHIIAHGPPATIPDGTYLL
jgi:hypothetical protein